jgi:hypothetical protein
MPPGLYFVFEKDPITFAWAGLKLVILLPPPPGELGFAGVHHHAGLYLPHLSLFS